jgi:hypothetical protein
MQSLPHPHLGPVLAALESLQATLCVAGALLDSGREVDLTGLEEEAARICLAAGMLPREAAAPIRAALEAALRDLDNVAAALTRAPAGAPGRPPPRPGSRG